MKESERLTARNKAGEAIINMTGVHNELEARARIRRYSPHIIANLCAYEDTGLSPEEVEKLKDKVYSTDEVNHLIAEMETLIRALKVKTCGLLMKIKVLEAEGKNGIQER